MCTSISYQALGGHQFFGRTQEYDQEYDYVLAQFPRQFEVKVAASAWQTKYAVMGVAVRQEGQLMPAVLDGINEFGLACTTQYFAEPNIYEPLAAVQAAGKIPVYAEQFIFYLLTNCRDLAAVRTLLNKVRIPDQSLVQAHGLPQHFAIKEASGAEIVV